MGDLGSLGQKINLNYPVANEGSPLPITTVSQSNSAMRADPNSTEMPQTSDYQAVLNHVNVVCYLLICAFGLFGNSLVIFVILMYAKMKKVTNMYILNLAISDVLFLAVLPITATTVIVKHWVFGLVLCKIYFVLCAINAFSGAFNLCVMSADRYLAVCHPIRSVKYRTPRVALCMCIFVWLLSFLVTIPLFLYTTTIKHHTLEGKHSCNIEWPDYTIPTGTAFILLTFVLGFLIPVMFICLFYVLIICRLRRLGAIKKSKENRRSHGRVTRLIFAVVIVYVVCWLPYWCFQVHSVFNQITNKDIRLVLLLNGFTVLSYSNSMLNPILYAFFSENFRQSFKKAFTCFSPSIVRTRSHVNGVLQCTSHTGCRSGLERAVNHEKVELSVMDNCSATSQDPLRSKIYSKVDECDQATDLKSELA